ncbi:type VII secretion protein EccB [Mycolicibacterium goodii]|uniref:type VII secretion protein EccB n=1 Tax=Mycolicibacterium goodii TaxID=134601 RepID=UPI001BDDC9CE|nr:type VII secretion protein EccB [Mycolicibacterium goodii]MBU8819278.1 type VII secretion protein EccB [Mycolicibacterium goodii]
MPLNYSTLEQVSAWRFLRHRLSVAVGRWNVRLVHDPSKNALGALSVGCVIAAVIVVLCFVVAYFKPVGQVGHEKILMDRATGQNWVEVDGVMHPALNLASARLIAGQAQSPKAVPKSEILKKPVGPMVGIVGAPDDLSVRSPSDYGWTLCDRLGSTGSRVVPRVTVLAGVPALGDWAHTMQAPQSVLMAYGGDTFVVTNGRRSKIDLADKPVTLALGLSVGDLHPVPMSRALYEALPPTAPLRVPEVPNAGGPVAYSTSEVPVVSGSVIRVSDAAGAEEFFAALPGGVQRVPRTVATMMLNAGMSEGGRVVTANAAQVATMPQATGFDTSIYPPAHLDLIDKAAEPVTCVSWRKGDGEPQAQVSTISGRRLPIPVDDEKRVISLVSAGPSVADAVYIAPDSSNFVQVTGVEEDSPRRESLWFITYTGVRFGIQAAGNNDTETRSALGLSDAPTPAPWTVIRWLPVGPVLSRDAAKAEHDTFELNPAAVPQPSTGPTP